MILADDIKAATGTEYDAASFGGIGRLNSDIEPAERFVLHRGMVSAVAGVSNSSPKSIMSARSYARAPFQTTWIEWLFQDVLDALNKQYSPTPDRNPPTRVGCLIEEVPETPLCGMITLAWCFRGKVEQSVFCQVYDMRETPPDLPAVARHFTDGRLVFAPDDPEVIRRDLEANPAGIKKTTLEYIRRDPSQLDHLAHELSRFGFVNNPRTLTYARWLQATYANDPSHLLKDWESEGLAAISSLIVLNSKNLSEREAVTQAKLNRKRASRGKAPLYPHTLLKLGSGISLSHGGSRSASRTHIVRGHFKVRKQGVFWWNPHVRGEGAKPSRQALRCEHNGEQFQGPCANHNHAALP